MQRVMIIGQPGSGKSTLARRLGDCTELPVFHIDHIHWQSGWVERAGPEKDKLCAQIHAKDAWIFEGSRSSTWPERLARCDTLIWLDASMNVRLWRVLRRTWTYYGRSRPDLPEGCPEQFSAEFLSYIWKTRHTARRRIERFFDAAPPDKARHRFESFDQVDVFLETLRAKKNGDPREEEPPFLC